MAYRFFLHKHSTLCGFVASAAVTALMGYLTQWSLPVLLVTAFAGISVFRLCYGRAASRALDEAESLPKAGGSPDIERDFAEKQSAARGEFIVRPSSGDTEPTRLISRRTTIELMCAAAALCLMVFGMEYAAEQYKIRTHPHHWYAVHLYVASGGRHDPPSGITVTSVDGPYASRDACRQFLKTQTTEYLEAVACREMTDADAAAASH